MQSASAAITVRVDRDPAVYDVGEPISLRLSWKSDLESAQILLEFITPDLHKLEVHENEGVIGCLGRPIAVPILLMAEPLKVLGSGSRDYLWSGKKLGIHDNHPRAIDEKVIMPRLIRPIRATLRKPDWSPNYGLVPPGITRPHNGIVASGMSSPICIGLRS